MAASSKNFSDFTGQVMTVDEVAELLRIHRSTLYRLVKTGKFPHFRMGSDFRFQREAIDVWRRAQEEKQGAPSRQSRHKAR
jgi:excisionase family DNA binding protein